MRTLPTPAAMCERATLVEVFNNGVVCESPCVYFPQTGLCTDIEAAPNCMEIMNVDVIRQFVIRADGTEVHEGFEIDMDNLHY